MWSPSTKPEGSVADVLDVLAGLLRSGVSIRVALRRWHREAPPGSEEPLQELARLLGLGMTPARALSRLVDDPLFGTVAGVLADRLAAAEALGADASAAVAGIAADARRQESDSATAAAAAAGARISGRLVAGLPLVFLLLAPGRRSEIFEGGNLVLVGAGVFLAIVGMRWIDKLVPKPDGVDDPMLRFVSNFEQLVHAGFGLRAALRCAAGRESDPRIRSLSALVRIGASWQVALERSPERFLRTLAPIVARADLLGVPITAEISRLIETRRDEIARMFEVRLRRAPVLMMVPLTLCVLPAYALLALGPFLRGLGFPSA